jgi:NNMT/PNMT/TEMT family
VSGASSAPSYSGFDAWDAKAYLREYYSSVMPDERYALEFLVDSMRGVGDLPLALDIGSGPCVHHAFPLVPKVREIHLADYVAGNREELQLWMARSRQAHDWTAFAAETLRLEQGKRPTAAQVRAREQQARARVSQVLPTDIRSADPLGPSRRGTYPLVTAHYCAEAISTDKAVFRSNVHNIASLLAPGATLIVSVCGSADHYKVGERRFPCSMASPGDVLSAFQQEGLVSMDLRVRLTPAHTTQGYSSVIFARGTKSS